jgi:RHS repeat-associated protein
MEPASDVPPGIEVMEMRTATSQTFEQTDGTFISQLYNDPVFYQPDGLNIWQPIDTHLVPAVEGDVLARVVTSPVQISLSAADATNGFASLEGDGHSVSFALPTGTAAGLQGDAPQIMENGLFAEYANFLPGGIVLRIFPQSDGFNSYLVLPSRPATNSFALQLSTSDLIASIDEEGTVIFTDALGTVVGRIPRPFMLDSSETEGLGGGIYSEGVTMTLGANAGGYLLTLAIDPAFLDAAVYPVYVDPSPTTFPTGSTTANDTFASERYPNSNFNTYQRPDDPYYHEMWHGHEPGYTTYDRMYIRFNDLAETLGTVHIGKASLQFYPYWQYNHYQEETSWVREVTSDWDAGTLKWSAQPSLAASDIGSFETTEGDWSDIDLKDFVQAVVNGTKTNNGWMIHADSIGNSGWKRIVSRNETDSPTLKPKLVVTWHVPSATVSSPTGNAWGNRTLDWTYSNGSATYGTAQSKYQVQVATSSAFTTIVRDSGWVSSSATNWTFPSSGTAMTEGTSYYWRVKVNDGVVDSAWTSSTGGQFKLDTLAPTADFSTPNEGTTTIIHSNTFTVAWSENGTGSNVASRSRLRERGTIVTPSSCAGVTWSGDGTGTNGSPAVPSDLLNGYCYHWIETLTDQAGNVGSETSGNVLDDTAAPTVDFSTPNEGATVAINTTSYTVAWSEDGTGTTISSRSLQRQKSLITSAGSCPTTSWSNDGSAVTSASSVNATGLTNGYAYRWVQTLADAATNSGSGTSGCVLVDTTVPLANFTTPDEGASASQSATGYSVAWTETGGGSSITVRSLQRQKGTVVSGACTSVSWSNEGSAVTTASAVSVTGLSHGYCYRWVQTLTNQAGSSGAQTSGTVLVDTTAPTATITYPEDGRLLAGTVLIGGTVSDATSPATYNLDIGAGASPTSWTSLVASGAAPISGALFSWNTGTLQGVYSVRLTVTDQAANQSVVTNLVYLQNSRRGEEAFYTRVPFDLGGGWRMAVGVANGELTLDRHLFEIPSYGPPQSLALSYSSQNTSSAGMFGAGWSSNLTQFLTFEDGFVVWHRADGGLVPFGEVDSVWTSLGGHFESLAHSGSEYTVILKDQSKLVFEDSGAGRLKRIENRFGTALTIVWSGSSGTATDASDREMDIVVSDGAITSVTDSAGREWTFGYDPETGELISVTDPEEAATDLAYGDDGLSSVTRERSRVSASPETITWLVDYAGGLVSGVRDPIDDSVANTFDYDAGSTAVGLLKEYSGPVRNDWTYTFDDLGRVTDTLDPEGYTTTYAFDADSNLTELVLPIEIDGDSQTISYAYENGNVLTQTTQLSATEEVVTAMTYNATNDLVTRSEANNDTDLKLVTLYEYDTTGHLISVDVNCTTTETTPPADAGTCTGEGTNDDSGTNLLTTYTYTVNDQVETETDPLGRVTKHVYDTDGNETETIQNFVSAGASTADQNVSTTFAYDSETIAGRAGLITSITDPVVNTASYEYDSLGRQTSEVLPGDDSIPVLTRDTDYDELGNVLIESEAWDTVERSTTHVYDKANRETSITDPADVENTTDYDAAGEAVSSTYGGVTTTRDFDGLGRVTCERPDSAMCNPEEPEGSTTTHRYDGQGRASQTVDPEGVTTSLIYDLGGRLLSETVNSEEGDLGTTYDYDLLGRQTSSASPDGVVRATEYDRAGRTNATTEAAATTTHAYDRAGNETSTTAPEGTLTTIQYDAINRATVVVTNDVATPTHPTEDVTTHNWYDAIGQRVAFTDATGFSSRSIYNVRGLLKSSISNCTDSGTTPTTDPPACIGGGTHNDKTNILTTIEYDGSGAVIVTVVAVGSDVEATIEYAYDAAGRRQGVMDPLGTVARTFYDTDGRLTDTIVNCTDDISDPEPPSGAGWWNCDGSSLNDGTWNVATSRTYDGDGNVASETAPNGRRTEYMYDDADRLVQRIDNAVSGTPGTDENISTFYAYDDAGRQMVVLAPSASRTAFIANRFVYDEAGHLEREIRNCTASGTTDLYEDPETDPSWKSCPDEGGQKDAAHNLITEYGYDDRGNRVAVTTADPSAADGTSTATVTTRYAFDEQNRLCGVLENSTANLATPDPCATSVSGTNSENVWTQYTYDELGNLASMIDAEGHTTNYGYDQAGRMATLTDADGNMTTYGFDALGRRTSQSERGTGSMATLVSWTYDATGRMLTRTSDEGATSYEYDVVGNRTNAELGDSLITTSFDRLNRPLTVIVDGDEDATTTYEYSLTAPSWSDPSGSYTAVLDAFGRQLSLADPVHGSSTFDWTYRADGRLDSISAPNGNATAFVYDEDGAITSKTTTNSSDTPASYVWTRNRAGQIVSEDSDIVGDPTNGTTEYAYDEVSRLTSYTRDSSTTAYSWQTVPNRDSVQVDSDAAVTTTFDSANRPTSDSGGGSYSHDDEGRLTARPGQVLEWNDLGQLITVTETLTNDPIAEYTYDALDRLLTVDHPNVDSIRFRYVGLTTQVAQAIDQATPESVVYSNANGWTGELLFEWADSSETFYGTNGHHDVTWTADASGDGNATLRYDPWGNLAATSGSSLPALRFQSSWFDSAVGLSWLVSRWYAPQLGRFISQDSIVGAIEQPSSRHLYAYGDGDPIRGWDPLGTVGIDDDPTVAKVGYWVYVQSGETPARLAARYLGTSGRAPTIVNRNRWTYGTDYSKVAVGACVFVQPRISPIPSGARLCSDPARHGPITGKVTDWHGLPIAGPLKDALALVGAGDWLQMTASRLKGLTQKGIGDRVEVAGPVETAKYGAATYVPDRVAEFIMAGLNLAQLLPYDIRKDICPGGSVTFSAHGEGWISGNSCVPAKFGGAALTMGHYVFVAPEGLSGEGCSSQACPPLWMQAHEYIHALQYQGRALDFLEYLADKTGPKARDIEAYGALWGAWTRTYSDWEEEPWQIWKPT